MIKQGLLAVGLLAALHSTAQEVSTYIPGALENGVVYYLPKTQLKITVKATKVTYTPGELCQYANRYLRLQNVSASANEYWKIDEIKLGSFGIPDAERVFAIKLKDKTSTSLVDLTDNGIIKAINTKSTWKEEKDTPAAKPAPKKKVNPRDFMTEEILMAGSSNKMAELIAQEIYNIRESKNSLTRGQADYMPQDGAALKLMLENLNKQEKALTEMFSGTTDYIEKEYTFTVDPSKELKDQIVFRMSNKLGILDKENLAGEPIYINLVKKTNLPPTDEEAKAKKKLEGVIYNVPGKAQVTIKTAKKTYVEQEVLVTQFGETEVLTDNLFNKKINTRVMFNPITGGILKIDKD